MAKLEFQDFHTQKVIDVEASVDDDGTTYNFKHRDDDKEHLLGDGGADESKSTLTSKNFWSFEYYQQLFDVDTDQVVGRVLNSMVPRPRVNFLTQYIRPTPDLYGPFWICVTVIFATAIFGNLAQYILQAGNYGHSHFESDFRIVSGAATAIFAYVTLVPFALYSLMWYSRSEVQYTYIELLSAYGYSLSIFVPVSMLFVVFTSESIRWTVVGISVLMSGSVLANSFWPAIRDDANKLIAVGTIIGIFGLHALLAIGFKEYFFDPSQPRGSTPRDIAVFEDPAVPLITDPATKLDALVTKVPEVAAQVKGENATKKSRATAGSADKTGNKATVKKDEGGNASVSDDQPPVGQKTGGRKKA